jgi:hypothetical protein
VRCVDVWTSLGAKMCVFQKVSPELRKGEKRGRIIRTRDYFMLNRYILMLTWILFMTSRHVCTL